MKLSTFIIMVGLVALVQAKTMDNFAIEPMTSSSGLYFEKLHSVRMKRAEWRLTTFVDVKRIIQQFPVEQNSYLKTYDRCVKGVRVGNGISLLSTNCEYYLGRRTIVPKMLEATKIRQQIIMLAKELENPDKEQLPTTIAKRAVPLGFVGSVSRYLFGTLTQEDAEYFNTEIDRLYDSQNNLTRVLSKQAHIVTGELRILHQQADQHERAINNLTTEINKLVEKVNLENTANIHVQYELSAFNYATQVERALDHYIQAGNKFLDTIVLALEEKIPRELIDGEKLQNIFRDIQSATDEFMLPTPKSHHRIEEIVKISTISVGYHQGRILLTLHVPLVDIVNFHIYHMHALPTPQKLVDSNLTVVSAKILPRTTYLGLSDNHNLYFLAEPSYLGQCIKTSYCYLCPTEIPLRETATSQGCEIQLLLTPNSEVLRQCDVRVKPTHETFWTQLSSIGAWLFSMDEPQILQLICKQHKDQLINLNGTGILYIRPGCIGKTREVTLQGIEILMSETEYLYQPNLVLNITAIVPSLQSPHLVTSLRRLRSQSEHGADHGTSLYDIEEELEDMANQHRKHQQNTWLIYGGYFLHIMVATLVVLYFCKDPFTTKVRQLIARRMKKEPEVPPTSPEPEPGPSNKTMIAILSQEKEITKSSRLLQGQTALTN